MKPEHVETIKTIGDGLSVVTVVATLVEVLPSIAALFTIIWTGLRILEMISGKEISELLRGKKDDDAV